MDFEAFKKPKLNVTTNQPFGKHWAFYVPRSGLTHPPRTPYTHTLPFLAWRKNG